MFFLKDGKLYIKEGNNRFRNIGIIAKDKIIEDRQLESVEVVPGTVIVDSLDDAEQATLDEIVRRFNVSEKNPIPVIAQIKGKRQLKTDE